MIQRAVRLFSTHGVRSAGWVVVATLVAFLALVGYRTSTQGVAAIGARAVLLDVGTGHLEKFRQAVVNLPNIAELELVAGRVGLLQVGPGHFGDSQFRMAEAGEARLAADPLYGAADFANASVSPLLEPVFVEGETEAGALETAYGRALTDVMWLSSAGSERDDVVSQENAWRLAVAGAATTLALLAVAVGLALALLRQRTIARSARELAEARLEHLSLFDPMTGISNETQFEDRVTGAISAGSPASVIILDLDGFGLINDRRGPAFGDVVIKEVAHRLCHAAEGVSGFAARIGGDRFGLWAPLSGSGKLADFCQHLIDVCAVPVTKGGEAEEPSVSIGAVDISQLGAKVVPGYDLVLRNACLALSASEARGYERVTLFDEALQERHVDRIAMMADLPAAIRSGELSVYLQPKIDLASGQVSGFEALVRWFRKGVLVPPGDLVRIAEQRGSILDLDRYMIEQATVIVGDWNRRRKTGFSVSVNLSAAHLQQDGGAELVSRSLAESRLVPELLTVEITETVEIDEHKDVGQAIANLRQTGCRISIDDFGSGYSSLAYLRSIAADELKIDRSLVNNIDTRPEDVLILQTILALASQLGLDVVVEGVEREAQAAILRRLGCRFVQGYLFGRPRPAADWLADVTYGTSDAA